MMRFLILAQWLAMGAGSAPPSAVSQPSKLRALAMTGQCANVLTMDSNFGVFPKVGSTTFCSNDFGGFYTNNDLRLSQHHAPQGFRLELNLTAWFTESGHDFGGLFTAQAGSIVTATATCALTYGSYTLQPLVSGGCAGALTAACGGGPSPGPYYSKYGAKLGLCFYSDFSATKDGIGYSLAAQACPAGFYCAENAALPTACGCPSACPPGTTRNVPTCSRTPSETPSPTATLSMGATPSTSMSSSVSITSTVSFSSTMMSVTRSPTPSRTPAYCPAGAPGVYCVGAIAHDCMAGYYGATGGLTTPNCSGACTAAPSYGCKAGATSAVATLCEAGYFCPGGTPAPAIRCGTPANCAAVGLTAEPPCVWNVSTLAGSGMEGADDSAIGTLATFYRPSGIAVDAVGTLYVANKFSHTIRRVLLSGAVSTLAGSGFIAYLEGTGAVASFNNPEGVAVHPLTGDIFCSEWEGHRIRRITPAGVTFLFAGSGLDSWANGAGTSASFSRPAGIAFDSTGALYVADSGNNMVRKILPLGIVGIVFTLAGNGRPDFFDGVGTTSAAFNNPFSVAVDNAGNVFVGDRGNRRIRKISTSAVVTTFAGSGKEGFDDGTGTAAAFLAITSIAFAASGNLLVTNGNLRMISPSGTVTTVAGSTKPAQAGDPISSRGFGTASDFFYAYGVAGSADGAIVVSDFSDERILRLSCVFCPASFYCPLGVPLPCPPGSYCPLSSTAPTPCPGGTYNSIVGASALSACLPCLFAQPGFACPAGSTTGTPSLCQSGFYCPGGLSSPTRCFTPANCVAGLSAEPPCLWQTSNLAGNGFLNPVSVNGAGAQATFFKPSAVAVDAFGNVFVADSGNNCIRKVIATGLVSTLAGNAFWGGFRDGTGTSASFSYPMGVAVHPISNEIFYADTGNMRIRRITPSGVTTTFAGNGDDLGSSDDPDGAGTSARFRNPSGLTFDSSGVLFVADAWRIRRVSPLGVVNTLHLDDSAYFLGVAVNSAGHVFAGSGKGYYNTDSLSHYIIRIAPTAVVTTFAGNRSDSWADGVGTAAAFNMPSHLAFAPNGNLLVADEFNYRVRMISPLGVVTTIAGNQSGGYINAFGTNSLFERPLGVTVSANGTVFIADTGNHRVRSMSCALCPAGYECASGFPLSCPLQSLCPVGAFYRADCPAGSYCPDTTAAILCPAGSFCPARSLSPQPCAPGTFASVPGRSTCILCAAGLLAPQPGSTLCDGFCPTGTFRARPGGVNTSSCSPCAPGSYGEAEGATSCTPCPLGTAGGALAGSNSSATCVSCPPGSFSASLLGAPSCSPCPSGTFASAPGLAACTPCPFNTYFSGAGAESPAACLPCPTGTITTAPGSTAAAACITGAAYQCAPGSQPTSPSLPKSQDDCAPLQCPPPLLLNAQRTGCTGCANGTFGGAAAGALAPSPCAPCPPNTLCPGLLSTPLLNFSAAWPATSACPYLTPSASLPASAASAASLPPSTVAAISGGALLSALLLATFATTLYNRLSGVKLPLRLKPYVHALDFFSASKPVTLGADKQLAERERSTLGASMSLLAVGALGAMGTVLATQRASSNTLTQQSLSLLRSSAVLGAASWPWAAASPADAAASGLPAPASGVFLRFSVSGEPGQCLPARLTSSGLSAGAWELAPSPPCAGAPYPVTQFTLACAQCMFTPASALRFTLPYSCQSMLAEAAAVDADGSLAVLALPADATAAPGAGRYLASVAWALSPLLSQLNSTIDPRACRRGWQLLSEGATATHQPLLQAASGNLTLLPLSAAVSVSVAFALQPFVATTTLSELTSVLQLLSNILGFQGVIFTAAGLLFGVLATSRKKSAARSERGALASSRALPVSALQAGRGGVGSAQQQQREPSALASVWRWAVCRGGGAPAKLTAAAPQRLGHDTVERESGATSPVFINPLEILRAVPAGAAGGSAGPEERET